MSKVRCWLVTQKGGLEPAEFEYGFSRDSNVTGMTLWGANRIAVFKFKILELLWKTALVATLCAVETLGFLSSRREDVLPPHTKFIC
jgi:hypothetical protein